MHGPSRSLEGTAYTICLRLCYKAARRITCQLSSFYSCPLWESNADISATIGVGIVSIALTTSPHIPGEFHGLLGTAYFALASAMACRVFREVILEIIKDPQVSSSRISTVVRTANNNRHDNDGVATSRLDKAGLPSDLKINIAVQMDTRTDYSLGSTLWDQESKGDHPRHDASHRV